MLEQICEQIHNYFIKEPNPGTYEIADGTISPLPDILEGQRIWIVGSALNDGVYTYHAAGLKDDDDLNDAVLMDETFSGSVCAMAVPKALLTLVQEISAWCETYAEAVNSPYQSENVIGVYSYTKATGSSGGADAPGATWQSHFASQLNRWRKVSL